MGPVVPNRCSDGNPTKTLLQPTMSHGPTGPGRMTRCTGIDAELNATLTTDELVSECLPLLELAQSRVHEQWRFNLQG